MIFYYINLLVDKQQMHSALIMAPCILKFSTIMLMSLAVRGHMAAVRQLFSNQGNHSEVMSKYHIGSFRGYGARMNDK